MTEIGTGAPVVGKSSTAFSADVERDAGDRPRRYLPVVSGDSARPSPIRSVRVDHVREDVLTIAVENVVHDGTGVIDTFDDAISRPLPASEPGEDVDVYALDPRAAIPFVRHISHRRALGKNLWVGIDEGVLIVLDERDDGAFRQLAVGASPAHVVLAARENGEDVDAAWTRVNDLLGRLAVAGFIRGIEGHRDIRRPEPHRFARLHLTKRCQLECAHCYADSSPQVSADGELSVERWWSLLDDIATNGGERVLFTGGEALVYRGCLDLMRHAKDLGLHVTLFSNGLLIERHLDALSTSADTVQISVDGPDPATNDSIRGPGTHGRALRAIRALLKRGIAVRMGMTVMERNWSAIRSGFVKFANEFAGTGLEIRLGYGVSHHGRGEFLGDNLTVQETRPIVDAMLETVRGPIGPKIARKTTGCGYAEQLVVAPDGTVYPCHLLDGPLTHIDAMPLGEILDKLKGTAAAFDVDHSLGCNTCDIRNLCGGTCRVQNGKRMGDRLVTTCTPADKQERYESLVRQFGGIR